MTRHISLSFPENDTVAVAELLDDQAPRTCEAIWRSLIEPVQGPCIHAMYCGREIIFGLPAGSGDPALRTLPAENQIVFPLPGDVCFKYFAPYELNNPGAEAVHEEGFNDFMIFYGRNARLFSSQGWVQVNLFARIVENLEGFAAMGTRVHREGMRDLRIARTG